MDRDRRFDEPRRGGESYRPSERPPRRSPRPDSRAPRSPPPFKSSADTWAPSNRGPPRSRSPGPPRRRSRSPPPLARERERAPGYGGWSRSPPRRPSRGRDAVRSPPPPRRSRSPAGPPPPRGRSPGLKRSRDSLPAGRYNPQSPNRERRTSPARNRFGPPRSPPREPYRPAEPRPHALGRSRSPRRPEGRGEPYGASTWRRRSPSAPLERSGQNSGQGSASTSRRSSPPPSHTDRMSRAGNTRPSPGYPGPRNPHEGPPPPRSPAHSNRFAPRRASGAEVQSSRNSSPQRRPSVPAPSPRAPESYRGAGNENENYATYTEPQSRPQRTSSSQQLRSPSDDQSSPKPPPTQPHGFNKPQTISPPTGPGAPTKMGPASRSNSNVSVLSAPTRPKGVQQPSFNKESPRDVPRPGTSRRSYGPLNQGPPSGPRAGPGPGTSHYDSHRPPPFRQNSSSSSTYPHTKRFTNPLAGMPTVVPGGKALPSGLDPNSEKRLAQLETDKEKLLEQIAEKQNVKRAGLREWDKLSRETATNALRSDLAEGHLQRLTEGDGIGGGAAF